MAEKNLDPGDPNSERDAAAKEAFRKRMTWRDGDVEVLTHEEAVAALGFDPEEPKEIIAETTDAQMHALATATASCLEQRAAKGSLDRVNERDDLQGCCVTSARELAPRWRPPPEVLSQVKVAFEGWPRLGDVDLVLIWPGEYRVLLELKCGVSKDALGPCVWDAAKCAFLLQVGDASAAYLLAATTLDCWEETVLGTELFTSGAWEIDELRERYASWWRQWERRGDPLPTKIPAQVQTEHVGTVPFAIGGTAWELRMARVKSSDDWRAWEPFYSLR